MCKGDYASYARINSPHRWLRHKAKGEDVCIIVHINGQHLLELSHSRICLTFSVRRNYYYISNRYLNAQTQPARPENQRTETDWHVQSPCGNRDRSLVPTEPFLRSPRSPAGPLRNATTTYRRRNVSSRCCYGFWRFAPHVLSGSRSVPTVRTSGAIAGAARAEGCTQVDHRSSGLHGQFAGVRSQAHHRGVRQSHSTTFCNFHPQTQPRASSGTAQKKTTSPDLRFPISVDAVAAYETLRPYLIDPADHSGANCGSAVLLRHGMLAWAGTLRQMPTSLLSPTLADRSPLPSAVSKELVQLMAGLILQRKGGHTCLS
jgi:hypothetical protein